MSTELYKIGGKLKFKFSISIAFNLVEIRLIIIMKKKRFSYFLGDPVHQ